MAPLRLRDASHFATASAWAMFAPWLSKPLALLWHDTLVVRLLVFDRFQNRVQAFEFHAGVSGGELPVDLHLCSVTVALPGSNFACQRGEVWDAAVEALPPQRSQFDFRHVEPTAVLWRIVHLQFVDQPPGFLRRECFIQRGQFMRV